MLCRHERFALQVFRNISRACRSSRQHAAIERVAAGNRMGFSVATQLNREKLGLNPTNKGTGSDTVHTPADFVALRGSNPDNRRLNSAIKTAAKTRDWEAAQSAFSEAAEPDSLLYSVLLWAADRCNQHDAGARIYDEMCAKGMLMSGIHFVPLIRLAGRSGSFDRVNAFRKEVVQRNIDMDAFICAALVEAHKLAGDIEGAVRTWDETRAAGKVVMTPPLLSAVMSATARSGNVAATEALLGEAASHFKPNRIHFNCVLDACKHAGAPDAAFRFFREEYPKHGINPDVVSFTLLLNVLRRSRRPASDIEEVLQQMRTSGVAADKFFLEEHLSCILPITLPKVKEGDPATIEALRNSPASGEALVLIEQAMADGMETSRMTRDLHRELKRLQSERLQSATTFAPGSGNDAGVQTPAEQWVKIITAQPAAGAPAEYFWERLSGRTQWEAPASPILETISN